LVTRFLRLFCFLLVLNASKGFAQKDSSFLLLRTYNGDIADAAIDNLDNLYIISSSGKIKKFTPSGDSVVYDQVKSYGKLFSLEVSNPLKILLLYKDYAKVVILDRFFAPVAVLDLKRYSILQPSAVGLSYDNNIWVFDEYDNKLKKIDEQGNHLLETPDFRSIFNTQVDPQKIISDHKLVYLADSANGVFVFDNYGSFKKRIDVKSWQSIAVSSDYIISSDNEEVHFYNMVTLMDTKRKSPVFNPYIHSFTSPTRLVTFSTDTLHIYQRRF
jgi:hypothetical protein